MMRKTLSRSLVAAGAAFAALAFASDPASAVSAPLSYACTWTVGDVDGTGSATATWDSGIPDGGLTIPPNVTFSLDPFTGTVVVPDTFAQELRDQGVAEVGGTGELQIYWDAAGGYGDGVIGLAFAATPVPASGPMTLDLTGVSGLTTFLNEMEPWSLVAGDFSLTGGSGAGTLSCHTAGGVIDTVNTIVDVTTAPPSTSGTTTPTGATTTSPSATRPALVQTDRPPTDPAPLPLLVAATGAALVGTAVAFRASRARRSRRH